MSSGSILVALTSEEDRDLACEILRDLIGVSIATTSVWALITIMFRHVLVKYSERGLVSGGGVSPLFGQLYLTLTLASSAVSYTVVASRHFHTESKSTETESLSDLFSIATQLIPSTEFLHR